MPRPLPASATSRGAACCALFLHTARGGAVRTYLILRRIESSGGVMGEWEQVGISLSQRITLSNQMRFRQLEYRVAAVNGAGVGVPSNTVAVVL